MTMTKTREWVVAAAAADLARFPQYNGFHADQAKWRLVTIRRDIRTKMGQSFLKGDVTIASITKDDGTEWITAWSPRTKVHTAIRAKDARWLDGAPTEVR